MTTLRKTAGPFGVAGVWLLVSLAAPAAARAAAAPTAVLTLMPVSPNPVFQMWTIEGSVEVRGLQPNREDTLDLPFEIDLSPSSLDPGVVRGAPPRAGWTRLTFTGQRANVEVSFRVDVKELQQKPLLRAAGRLYVLKQTGLPVWSLHFSPAPESGVQLQEVRVQVGADYRLSSDQTEKAFNLRDVREGVKVDFMPRTRYDPEAGTALNALFCGAVITGLPLIVFSLTRSYRQGAWAPRLALGLWLALEELGIITYLKMIEWLPREAGIAAAFGAFTPLAIAWNLAPSQARPAGPRPEPEEPEEPEVKDARYLWKRLGTLERNLKYYQNQIDSAGGEGHADVSVLRSFDDTVAKINKVLDLLHEFDPEEADKQRDRLKSFWED